MYLLPGMPVIKIDDTTLQFGSDTHAIKVEDLNPALIEIVLAAHRQRGKLARYLARRFKVEIPIYESLLQRLKAKHLLVDKLPDTTLESCFLRLYGASPLAGRNQQTLEITGLPRFSSFLIECLQEYQFSYFKIADKSLISQEDTDFYPPLAMGQAKEKFFPQLLQKPLKYPGARQIHKLAVGIFNYRLDFAWAGRQQRRHIPHLPIIIGENQIQLGPILEPNIGICSTCIYLQEKEKTKGREPNFERILSKTAIPAPPFQRMVAYFCGEQISNFYASIPHRLRNQSAVFTFGLGSPTFHKWEPHPECGCTLNTVATPIPDNKCTDSSENIALMVA